MKHWRRESTLDLYNLLFAVVLLAAPWLFTLTNNAGKLDLWASGAAIAAISLAALFAFARWEEWVNLLLALWLIVSPLAAGLCPYPRDAFQHRHRVRGRVPGPA